MNTRHKYRHTYAQIRMQDTCDAVSVIRTSKNNTSMKLRNARAPFDSIRPLCKDRETDRTTISIFDSAKRTCSAFTVANANCVTTKQSKHQLTESIIQSNANTAPPPPPPPTHTHARTCSQPNAISDASRSANGVSFFSTAAGVGSPARTVDMCSLVTQQQ
jgi:hypothetical protein